MDNRVEAAVVIFLFSRAELLSTEGRIQRKRPVEGSRMAQHTQGPWIVSLDPRYPSEPCIDAVIDGVVWHIALCHNAAGPDDGSAEANARLIAAAPELLATVKDALPLLRADRSRYEAALAVLAKIDENH
ncbi:hypothetical protein [Steroidobacter agaridevorans]|nr:hypothetical protein [Steroidobacter agaridevorans]